MRSAILLFLIVFIIPKSYSGSLYLSLHQNPAIEAKIERLFIIANMAIIKRPIAIKSVYQALEKTQSIDSALTHEIKQYLQRYDKKYAVNHASATISSDTGTTQLLSNDRGQLSHSNYAAGLQAYYAITENIYLNAGILTYDVGSDNQQTFAEGTYLSVGPDYLQVDLGYRPHWFSPFQDSSMLMSSNAPSIPSITVSNVSPLSPLGVRYEIFYGKMSHTNHILSNDRSEYLAGYPKVLGFHVSFSPVESFSIGFNKVMQYGGADNSESVQNVLQAFFAAGKFDNTGNGEGITRENNDFGNQLTSINTRYTFSGSYPVAVYLEYAGEDTSNPSPVHMGNASLMAGLHLPKFTSFLDLSYEYAQWQNAWYINGNYPDGFIQNGAIMGHWAASKIGKGIPAFSQNLKLIWLSHSSHELHSYFRQFKNESFNAQQHFQTGHEISLEYAYNLKGTRFGATWLQGTDISNNNYTRLAGFIRW